MANPIREVETDSRLATYLPRGDARVQLGGESLKFLNIFLISVGRPSYKSIGLRLRLGWGMTTSKYGDRPSEHSLLIHK